MDYQTQKYYETNAEMLIQRYESADMNVLTKYKPYFPSSGKLLEIGCGSGRDLVHFLSEGYDVIGVDASSTMVQETIKQHPVLENRIKKETFPFRDTDLLNKKFDIVICIAVMMHIQDHDIFECIYQFRKLLNPGGLLLISVSNNRQDLDAYQRDDKGRLFIERQPEQYQLMFERLGFSLINREENKDGLGRDNINWTSLLFRCHGDGILRPADQIEAIINRDRKDATYKLALLRALCDIAISEYQQAKWLPHGKIGIPLGLVAEKWIYYYWPIFESERFVPQKRGKEIKKTVNFRNLLSNLIKFYSKLGGLNRFYIDFRSGNIPDDAKKLTDAVVNRIAAKGIVEGPVQYSGGSLDSDEPFFSCTTPYQQKGKCISADGAAQSLGTIKLSSDIWREFCLIGFWIRESIILRWAELTYDISEKDIEIPYTVEKLLIKPTSERDQSDAKRIYEKQGGLFCVWTDKPLRKKSWDVDHVIPYSIWYNNDLWNLLPSNKTINRQKSDKLVTHKLLLDRRDCIIDYWKVLRTEIPNRFDLEIKRSLYSDLYSENNWEIKAFSGLVEAVEFISQQRGIMRWEP